MAYAYDDFIVTTTETVPGYRVVRVLGVVAAGVVLARNIGWDILAALRNIVGGEIKEYTELMARARDIAVRRLVEKARGLGANGVVGLRFATSVVSSLAAEVLAYGTAVVLERAA